MAWPIGNEYYKLRSKDGRDKIFEKPDELAESCDAYFEWVLNNPLKEQQLFNTKDDGIVKEYVDKTRPFTLEGLCNFIDMSTKGFKLYAEREDFIPIYTRARQIIDNQQFEGAAAGFLNASIIARKQGLSEHVSVHTEQPLFPPLEDES